MAKTVDGDLRTYREKRDFEATPEPSGERAVKPAEHSRFVIQKHDATRLHYDLRLELDGVFKSWAVTKGPSLDPAERRLAVEVEDHPLDYGDFEGTIPKGEYGGGAVMVWDRGYWAPESKDPRKALAKGELRFIVAGHKVEGGFILTRMARRRGEKRNSWLLIKQRDAYAVEDGADKLLRQDRSVASSRTMDEIAAGKGRKPEPFMLETAGAADAVWRSSRSSQSGAQFGAGPQGKRAGVSSGARIRGVALSNAGKPLWPAAKGGTEITKADLAHYYETVCEWMLSHIRGRPCSVIRAPDGVEAEQFFQRHPMQGAPQEISRVKVKGRKESYIQFDSAEALIAAAQIAVVEIHPWNCQPDDPEIPGRIVFDLDPAPGVAFDDVVVAARELRDRLAEIGLAGFCKTTGGKGLHVVTPFNHPRGHRLTWKAAKGFAFEVCRQMAEDSPDRYLVNMSKQKRDGKIFLDYLRNDRMQTAVAPLSPRARPGAPVSMPLNWTQARRGLDPMRFTLRTASRLLKNSAPWEDYCDNERPFLDAAEKLLSKG